MAVLGGGLALNVPLNYIFIYGNFGAPALGVAGAGVATFIARSVSFLVLLALVWREPELRPHWAHGAWARLATARVRRMLALGLPSAAQIVFEVGLFSFATLMAAMIGTVTLDAHQIALQVASLAFMGPLGISMATGIRVSRAVGGAKLDDARRIGWSSIFFAVLLMAAYMVFVLFTRRLLPELFLRADEPGAQKVFPLAATLLAWAASFAVFDGAQVTALGALRGWHDVRIPSAIMFAAYWVVSAPLAWYLGLHLGHGGPGLWAGLVAGLIVVATLLVGRFAVISGRR
jgi:MATE family multidrug resistance protein